MDIELVWSLLLFTGSAVAVMWSGTFLAKHGDRLAYITGWGRLWVGTVLIAIATSLPELVTNIVAAVRNQPELIGGTILGSNMANMFLLAIIVLIFKKERFLWNISYDHTRLILFAILFAGITLMLSGIHIDISLKGVGASSLLVLVLYLLGIRLVYAMRPQTTPVKLDNLASQLPSGVSKTWSLFCLAALGVVISSSLLTFSIEDISTTTGLSTSFLGVLAVAIVTTMPEIAISIAATKMGASDLVIGNIYGSCIFNLAVFAFADPFYSHGTLIETLTTAHIVAGISAIILMVLGLSLIASRGENKYFRTTPTLWSMVIVYIASLCLVYVVA